MNINISRAEEALGFRIRTSFAFLKNNPEHPDLEPKSNVT